MHSSARQSEQEPQQKEPVVFLWSVRRHGNLEEDTLKESAVFVAFGKEWQLIWQEYEKSNVNELGVFLKPICPDEEETRFDTFVRNEKSGPDLDRKCLLTVIAEDWGMTLSRATVDLKKSVVLGVAIYPPKAPIARKKFVPAQTATSSCLYQKGDTASLCLLTHQIPAFEYGTFSHLLADSKRSDITFIVEDEKIPAHTIVLQNGRAGQYFAGLLAHPFKENTDGCVHIDHVPCRIFKAILEFIYTGRTAVTSEQDLLELYRYISRLYRFQITTLLPYIKGELILSLNDTTRKPDDLLNLIRQLQGFPDLTEAVRICVKAVLKDWANAKMSENWRALFDGPDAQDFVEGFLDQAAELVNRS
ncbi:BTB/POZ domain-containing protein 9 [Borealophlyctis nickersoniae]|nr:BTB/POZ domain-containing protein 9 [Borealophlyctis nickersoniae]